MLGAVYLETIRVFGFFFFSSRRRHTRCSRDWSSDVCSSDLGSVGTKAGRVAVLMPIGSARRHDRGAGARHLGEVLALGPFPVQRDPLAPRERAVGVGLVEAPDQGPPSCAAATARAALAGRRRPAGVDELRRFDDRLTEAAEAGEGEATGGPVPAGGPPTVGGDSHPPA